MIFKERELVAGMFVVFATMLLGLVDMLSWEDMAIIILIECIVLLAIASIRLIKGI